MSGALCVICDRPVCRHDVPLYSSPPFEPSPVTTETGEAMRLEAVAMLSAKYRELAERSKTFSFSSIEGTQFEATGHALDTLAVMAPASTLVPADSKAWWLQARA